MTASLKNMKLTEQLLVVSVFFLPLFQVVSLICWVIILFISLSKKGTLIKLKTIKDKPVYILFMLLYVFYAIGMFWTEHVALGIEDLQIKLPLVIFPILFTVIDLNESSLSNVRKGLVFGCLSSIIYCFVISYIQYMKDNQIGNFFYTGFSHLMHPTYYTMFINLAILMLLDGWIKSVSISRAEKIGNGLLLFVFISTVIILSARLAMVATFFTMTIFVLLESMKQKNIKKLFPVMSFGVIGIVLLAYFFINLNNRFTQIADVIEKKDDPTALKDTVNNVSYNSTTIRIGLFKNGLAIFEEHPWIGVGTGDVIPESVKRLDDQGLHILALKSKGAHNQYLQTAVTLGVFALLLLILCITWPLLEFLKAKEYLFAAFMGIVLINAIGDTVLRASSLYFFTLFACFFYRFYQSFGLKKV
jgi:O-antigen ligase